MTHPFLNRPRTALLLFGLWFPPENCLKIPYLIYRSLLYCIQSSFVVFNFIYMVMVWGDLEETSEAFYLLFTEATVCLKVSTFLLNKNRLTRLLRFMESDIFASQSLMHDKILSVTALKMWRVYIFFLVSAVCNCTEWVLAPWFENHETRSFPFKIWMPADPTRPLDYYIGYTYQMIVIYVSASIYMTIDFITVSMIMFASAQLEIIAMKINQIPPVPLFAKAEEKEGLINENNKVFCECIQHHQAVIRFVGLVENMFNVNIFFQMSGTVMIICIICFRITIEPPNSIQFLSTLNYLVTMLAQLYLYCWCGNELTDRSQLLRNALYMSSWHTQDKRFRRALALSMECMKRPIVFRAGYYIPLSRPTFVSILRCSYSYFAVLNKANNK